MRKLSPVQAGTSTYLKMFSSASLGEVLQPASNACSLLTLCVAVDTGVTGVSSFSFKYLRPVSGVEGAKLRVWAETKNKLLAP